MPELANLDLLRSLAVGLVVFAHATLYLQRPELAGFLGPTGVCMFFVHTCLVLMGSLERDPHPGRFYLRRIFRIYPLWLVVLLASVLLKVPASPKFAPLFLYYHPDLRDLLGNALLLMNVYGYPDVVGASWTLPLEVQMYLFLPLIFALVARYRAVWPLLVVQGYLMFYAWRILLRTDASLLQCVPYFLPGAMGYLLLQRTRLRRLPAWMFAPCVAVLIAVFSHHGNFRRNWIFCLALGLGLPLFQQIRSPRVNRATAAVARYSYGVYLTHIPALCVGIYLLREHSLAVRLLSFAGLLIGLPVLLYHGVERPCIRLGSRLAAKIGRGPEPRADERMMRMEPAP